MHNWKVWKLSFGLSNDQSEVFNISRRLFLHFLRPCALFVFKHSSKDWNKNSQRSSYNRTHHNPVTLSLIYCVVRKNKQTILPKGFTTRYTQYRKVDSSERVASWNGLFVFFIFCLSFKRYNKPEQSSDRLLHHHFFNFKVIVWM